ncbi:hypothetical protein ACVPOQ_15825 [Staphylococcus aureus]
MTFDSASVCRVKMLKKTNNVFNATFSDKKEKISQHDIDYCIVVNFSSRFANVSVEDFVENYIELKIM